MVLSLKLSISELNYQCMWADMPQVRPKKIIFHLRNDILFCIPCSHSNLLKIPSYTTWRKNAKKIIYFTMISLGFFIQFSCNHSFSMNLFFLLLIVIQMIIYKGKHASSKINQALLYVVKK